MPPFVKILGEQLYAPGRTTRPAPAVWPRGGRSDRAASSSDYMPSAATGILAVMATPALVPRLISGRTHTWDEIGAAFASSRGT
jgi:hypothetical protein